MTASDLRAAFFVDAVRGRNGVGTYYEDLVSQLRGSMAESALFCPSMNETGPYQGRSFRMPGDKTQRVFLPRVQAIGEAMRALRPHVVVAPVPGPYGLLGAWHARRRKVPLCICYQTDYAKLAELYWPRILGAPATRLANVVHRRFFRAGRRVAAISEDMMIKARRAGVRRPRLIGTPLGSVFLDTPPRPLRPELEQVLFLGRLAPEKNVHLLFDAAERLPEKRFRIAGDGPLRDEVVAQARRLSNLEYLGWLSREQVAAQLDAADMLVLPSKVEAFGTVAVEAMARGRLVLTSPDCGVTKWPALAGALFTIAPGEAVHGAIARVAALPAGQRVETAARARAAATRLNEATLDQWRRLLYEAVAPSAAAAGVRPIVAAQKL